MIICLKRVNKNMENQYHKTAIKLVPKIRINPLPQKLPPTELLVNEVKKIASLSDLIKGGYITKFDIKFDGMNFIATARLNGNEEFVLSGVSVNLLDLFRSLEKEVLKNQFEI